MKTSRWHPDVARREDEAGSSALVLSLATGSDLRISHAAGLVTLEASIEAGDGQRHRLTPHEARLVASALLEGARMIEASLRVSDGGQTRK